MLKRIGEYGIHFLFGVLFILSIFLYKERLFVDASYYFFKSINAGFFHIEHGRIVLALSQIGPLIATFLNLPFKLVMIAASLWHEVFFYLVFLLTFYGLKDRLAGLAVFFIHIVGQSWLFYVPMVEIYYGAALFVPFLVILKSGRYHDQKYLLLMFSLQWLVMTSHPLNFSLIAFAMAQEFLINKWKDRVFKQVLLLMIISLIMLLTAADSYESDKISGLSKGSRILEFLNFKYLQLLGIYLVEYYFEVFIFFLISIFTLVKSHKIKSGLVSIGFMFSVVFLASYRGVANTSTWYTEVMYSPFVTIGVISLFCYSNLKFKSWLYFLLILAMPRVYLIWNEGEDLRKRMIQIEYLTDQIQELEGSKFLIEEDNFNRNYSLLTWSNPLDVLMSSATDGPSMSISLCTTGEYRYENNNQKLNDSSFIFRMFEVKEHSFLREDYFQIDKGKYHWLNSSNPIDDFLQLDTSVSVHILEELDKPKVGDSLYLWVKIFNSSEQLIPSLPIDQVYLQPIWYKDNQLYKTKTENTPLMIDLRSDFIQDVLIHFPKEKGEYYLEVALFYNQKKIGINNMKRKLTL